MRLPATTLAFLSLVFSSFVLSACGGSPASSDPPPKGDGGNPSTGDAGQVVGGNDSGTSPSDDGSVGGQDGGVTPQGDMGSTPIGTPDAGPLQGTGTTYYVDPKGADSNPGTSTSPWLTIQQAGAVVKAGDTVVVRAGTYDAPIFGWDSAPCTNDVYCNVIGTKTNPVLFQADPAAAAGSVIIAGKNHYSSTGFDLEPGCDYVNIVGFTVTNAGTKTNPAGSITKAGISVSGSTGNLIVGNTVNGVSGIGGIFVDGVTDVVIQGNTSINTKGTNTTGHGMYVSGSSTGVQVVGNLIHDNQTIGLHINGDVSEGLPGVVKSLLIEGNQIYNNGQNGINADGLQSSRIVNNLIYGNARDGIELYQIDAYGGSTGNVIVNNTIDQSMTGYAISIDNCQYDNQSSQPTPANCNGAGDTSTGNIAFDNVLLGKSGPSSVVTNADLALNTNITSSMSGLFQSGGYMLAPGGPGVGKGVASFMSQMAPAATGSGGTGYDIGAFAY